MTETVEDIVVSALQEILVQASEAPIPADESQIAIKYLNRMMAKFDAQGISLGYTQVADLADEITVADGALDGIVKNLAISLFPQYSVPGTPIDPLLVEQARDGLDTMRMISINSIGPSLYPGTLPVGSGNEGDNSFSQNHFYDNPEDSVDAETGGYISIESETDLP
jgi:hypothetical protein